MYWPASLELSKKWGPCWSAQWAPLSGRLRLRAPSASPRPRPPPPPPPSRAPRHQTRHRPSAPATRPQSGQAHHLAATSAGTPLMSAAGFFDGKLSTIAQNVAPISASCHASTSTTRDQRVIRTRTLGERGRIGACRKNGGLGAASPVMVTVLKLSLSEINLFVELWNTRF